MNMSVKNKNQMPVVPAILTRNKRHCSGEIIFNKKQRAKTVENMIYC